VQSATSFASALINPANACLAVSLRSTHNSHGEPFSFQSFRYCAYAC
jgi:hypothetical protein